MRIPIVLMLLGAGCSSTTAQSDGGGVGNDLASSSTDLTSSSMTLAVAWDLITANIQGGTNNGFAINCDDPSLMASTLVFTTKNAANQTATTMVACPAAMNSGNASLSLPDQTGPFTLSAVIAGKPMSSSDKLQNVAAGQAPHVHIYAFGCDMPFCM
jgi:hypothetical protein